MQLSVIEDRLCLAEGYADMLDMSHTLGKILGQLAFLLVKSHNSLRLMPLLLVFRILHREPHAFKMKGGTTSKAALLNFVSATCYNYNLISDYSRRPEINDI